MVSLPLLLQAQAGGAGSIFWIDGFRKEAGPAGSAGYTALLSRQSGASVSLVGDKFFGTDLAAYELTASWPMKTNAVGLFLSRFGTPLVQDNQLSASWAKMLDADFSLAIKMGVSLSVARGYYQRMSTSAGVGLLWDISDQCRWLLQAEDLQALIMPGALQRFVLRSGLGYRFSDDVEGSVQVMVQQGGSAFFMLAVEYRVADQWGFRMGYSEDQFMAGALFRYGVLDLSICTRWHMALGFSHGIGLACRKRSKG